MKIPYRHLWFLGLLLLPCASRRGGNRMKPASSRCSTREHLRLGGQAGRLVGRRRPAHLERRWDNTLRQAPLSHVAVAAAGRLEMKFSRTHRGRQFGADSPQPRAARVGYLGLQGPTSRRPQWTGALFQHEAAAWRLRGGTGGYARRLEDRYPLRRSRRLLKLIKAEDWNEYTSLRAARGDLTENGVVMSAAWTGTGRKPATRASSPCRCIPARPLKVQYRDLASRMLDPARTLKSAELSSEETTPGHVMALRRPRVILVCADGWNRRGVWS
jgi:hypothetical protein